MVSLYHSLRTTDTHVLKVPATKYLLLSIIHPPIARCRLDHPYNPMQVPHYAHWVPSGSRYLRNILEVVMMQ